MSAYYDFQKNPSKAGKEGEAPLLHPRIVSRGTITTDELLGDIAHATSFTKGDLEGVLAALTENIAYHLREGYHVELGRLGYFSASLKATREVTDPKKIRAANIFFDNVRFRASAWFRKHARGQVERAKWLRFRESDERDEAELRQRLEKYLDKHGFITRKNYTSITGRLKNRALKDLNLFVQQGVIERMGAGNQLYFVRAKVTPAAE